MLYVRTVHIIAVQYSYFSQLVVCFDCWSCVLFGCDSRFMRYGTLVAYVSAFLYPVFACCFFSGSRCTTLVEQLTAVVVVLVVNRGCVCSAMTAGSRRHLRVCCTHCCHSSKRRKSCPVWAHAIPCHTGGKNANPLRRFQGRFFLFRTGGVAHATKMAALGRSPLAVVGASPRVCLHLSPRCEEKISVEARPRRRVFLSLV